MHHNGTITLDYECGLTDQMAPILTGLTRLTLHLVLNTSNLLNDARLLGLLDVVG